MQKIPQKRIKIGKKYWKIFSTNSLPKNLDGTCDKPCTVGRSIQISERLCGEEMLDTIIHEMMHARHWDLSEEAVTEFASDVARFLWNHAKYRAEWDRD